MATFEIVREETCGRTGVQLLDNGAFFYLLDGERVHWAHSMAEAEDGRRIATNTAKRTSISAAHVADGLAPGLLLSVRYEENDLILEQRILLPEEGAWISVQVVLSDVSGTVSTRRITPILTPYPDVSGKPLFLTLDQKMLLVPYDNDMWLRYEAAPMSPGHTSYDVTAIFSEETREGLVVGALDFDCWKNAIAGSLLDARSIAAYSGAADIGTHDLQPHGCLKGESVASARFVMLWNDDVRCGLEEFGDLCATVNPPLPWDGQVPFGFNTYSGLGVIPNLDSWKAGGDLIHELANFGDDDGTTYVNLDAVLNMDENKVRTIMDGFRKRGQKVGTYATPIVVVLHYMLDRVVDEETGTTLRDMLLKDKTGQPLHMPDGHATLDTTHPQWEKYARAWMRRVVDMGIDYLKIDFLSHGALEGQFADPSILTGRMALNRAYRILLDELSKSEKPIFIDLSIAPLFPVGYGHARRSCCDSFGHGDDVRYVLNALSFGWWESGRLYRYNDPDHTVLYRSIIDGCGPTTTEEARSRYNASVISGTVMLLSDDYGPIGDPDVIKNSRDRACMLANNPRVNAIARLGKAFRPVELNNEHHAVFTLQDGNRWVAAVFNYTRQPQTISTVCKRAGLPASGRVTDLNREISWDYSEVLHVALAPMDSAILEIHPD